MSISYQNINSSNKEDLIKSCLGIVRKIAWHYHGRVKNIIEIMLQKSLRKNQGFLFLVMPE